MAAPSTPSNFYVQQGNGQVYLSWDISTGAVGYTVQRSTDNVTFTIVGSPSINSYLDASVTVGTQYYYQVCAYAGGLSSLYTNSTGIVPALTGVMSLGQIRQLAYQRADMENSGFVTKVEANVYINQSLYELYDLLETTYEDYFITAPYVFTTDGTAFSYNLPPNFYKLNGVDIGLSTGNIGWVTISKFDFINRNDYVYPAVTNTFAGVFNCRYRLVGNSINLIPTPSAGQSVRVWYTPRMPQLLKDTDMFDGFNGWLQYVIIRAAKYMLNKQEADTSTLDQELAFLIKRIEETASNRDAGAPDTISRTRRMSSYGPNGSGDNGGW